MRGFAMMRFAALLLLSALWWAAGCRPQGAAADRADRDPLVRRARAMRSAHDYDGAIVAYNKALDRNGEMAQAHLEVAQVYDQDKHDDLRAIYHYQRFLELNPGSEKAGLVRELIGRSRLSFAASLPARPSEAVRELEMLKKEVATLRALLAERTGTVAAAAARAPAAAAPAALALPAPQPAAPVAATQASYVVRPGDTLSRIATRFYNDPGRWTAIYEANRSQLQTPQSLKVGQTLVIPNG